MAEVRKATGGVAWLYYWASTSGHTVVRAEITRHREAWTLSVRLKKETLPPDLPFGGCFSTRLRNTIAGNLMEGRLTWGK